MPESPPPAAPGPDPGIGGDPARHLDLAAIEAALAALPPAPRDVGAVRLVVARPGPDRRRRLPRAALTVAGGLEGDRWRPADDGRNANQLTVIRLDQIAVLANGQDPAFAGDNLFVDLDLSAANLPAGSQLRVGSATVEVSPEPHDGCAKFAARFGAAALRAVQDPAVRAENRRGVHWRVIADGEVAPGDPITVLRRAGPAGA